MWSPMGSHVQWNIIISVLYIILYIMYCIVIILYCIYTNIYYIVGAPTGLYIKIDYDEKDGITRFKVLMHTGIGTHLGVHGVCAHIDIIIYK